MTFLNHFASEPAIHISLPAETVFHVGPLAVTNSMVLGVFGYLLTFVILFYTAWAVKTGRKNRFVSTIQWIFETFYTTASQIINNEKVARRVAPLVVTMFFFIVVQYWLGALPIVGPITMNGVPLFRGLVSDLNVTFALTIITMVTAQIYAVRQHGLWGNAKRYLRNPIKDPIGAFQGLLEIIAEFSRGVALSLRLFGNVFSGEVLLMMVVLMTSILSPLVLPPFLIFELFIGAIQAYIFFMLSAVFISLGLVHHDNAHDNDAAHSPPEPKKAMAGSDA